MNLPSLYTIPLMYMVNVTEWPENTVAQYIVRVAVWPHIAGDVAAAL